MKWDGGMVEGVWEDEGEVCVCTYFEITSPRKAFSFAMSGGLKVDCAFSKYVKPTGADIFSVLEDDEAEAEDLTLLMREPIVSVRKLWWKNDAGLLRHTTRNLTRTQKQSKKYHTLYIRV